MPGLASASSGTLRLPASVHFGYGVRAQVPRLLAAHGRRVFAVVDPFLAESPEFLRIVADARAVGLTVEIHASVLPELPVD